MVVHDEETLEKALALVAQGPVRYSDTYLYIVVQDATNLEHHCRTAFNREDIAIVVPQGEEATMEVHAVALARIKDKRRRAEKKMVQEYFREHPESVANVEKYAKKRGELKDGES